MRPGFQHVAINVLNQAASHLQHISLQYGSSILWLPVIVYVLYTKVTLPSAYFILQLTRCATATIFFIIFGGNSVLSLWISGWTLDEGS